MLKRSFATSISITIILASTPLFASAASMYQPLGMPPSYVAPYSRPSTTTTPFPQYNPLSPRTPSSTYTPGVLPGVQTGQQAVGARKAARLKNAKVVKTTRASVKVKSACKTSTARRTAACRKK